MQNYLQHTGQRQVARQGGKIPGKEHLMVKNSSGAFTFELDDWKRLERFLILGSDQPTYYASARKLTLENVASLERLLAQDGPRVVKTIQEVSSTGRAPNNDPALFALAYCLLPGKADLETRRAAAQALTSVARTGTHLYHFVKFSEGLGRGWGRMLKHAVAGWFNSKTTDSVAHQLMKYKQRDGWSSRDLFRLAHPNPGPDPVRKAIYQWVTHPEKLADELPARVLASIDVQALKDVSKKDMSHVLQLINDHRLPREVLPTELLNHKEIWEAMLDSMPMTAMVRNLGKMSSVGLLTQMSEASKIIVSRLEDAEYVQRSMLHPLAVLKALRQYSAGHGERGKLSWQPVQNVVDALDGAFRLAFKNVVPTGKRIGLFLDISSSMCSPALDGLSLSPREASAAMSLVTMNSERNYGVWGFSHSLIPLNISPKQSLAQVCSYINLQRFGSTDISLPFTMALEKKLELDAFIVYTDNETNHSYSLQPSEALKQYRQRMGVNAKLIVVGMTSNGFTVADPTDNGMLDVVGFDTSAPAVMSDFITDGQQSAKTAEEE